MGQYICHICGEKDYMCDCERRDLEAELDAANRAREEAEAREAKANAKLAAVGEEVNTLLTIVGETGPRSVEAHLKGVAHILADEPEVLAVVEDSLKRSGGGPAWTEYELPPITIAGGPPEDSEKYIPVRVIVIRRGEK